MTDKEKEAIKGCNLLLNGDITLHILDDDGGTAYAGEVNKLYNEDLETVLNLIQTQQEEIEKLKQTELKAKGGAIKVTLEGLLEMENKILNLETERDQLKMKLAENCVRTLNSNLKQNHKHEEDLEALHLGWKAEIEKKDTKIALLEQLYKNLQKDFDSFKKDEDIHYLDGIHHKKLVEKSVGQKIDKPEECWFDIFEVKVIKNEMLYGITIKEDFINLKQIADTDPENCITVIAEGPLSGAIYRYNNYGTKEWQLIGTMLGYT